MELKITDYVEGTDCSQFSDSVHNSGLANIGEITWRNAVAQGKEEPLATTPEQLDEARDYFAGFGAWDSAEVSAWSPADINGLLVQEIASAVRDLERYDTPEEYEKAAESGEVSGRIFRGDDGEWYIYIGM